MRFINKLNFLIFLLLSCFFQIYPAFAAIDCDPSSAKLCNPTTAGSIEVFLTNIFTGLGAIIGVVTISMVVYSGFRMIISQGKEEEVSKAKTSLQWSITGFILVILAFVIISAVGQFLGAQNIAVNPGEIKSPIASPDFLSFANTILKNFLGLAGTVALLFIIINGFRYMTARGNEEQTGQARQGLQWSVIGLVIILLAYVIVAATANLFK